MKHTKELYLSQTLYNKGHQKCQGDQANIAFANIVLVTSMRTHAEKH